MKKGKKIYSFISFSIIVGLLLLLCQTEIEDTNCFWYFAFGNIANTLIVTSTITVIYNLFLKSDEERNLIKLFKLSYSVHDSGLNEIITDSKNYNYSNMIKESDSFFAVMNDGLRWVGNNSQELELRFNRNSETEFFLVNPNGDFCRILSQKVCSEYETIKDKIISSINLLISTYEKSQKKGTLKIFLLKNYPTQTIFLSERKVVITPYQTASGRNVIPLYEYNYVGNKTSIGYYIASDVENIRKESKMCYDSASGLKEVNFKKSITQ